MRRHEFQQAAVDEFIRLTPASRAWSQRLSRVTPSAFLSTPGLAPYPLAFRHADGPYLYDVDGREIVDFFCAHFGALLGDNHATVREAIRNELDKGLMFGLIRSPHELESPSNSSSASRRSRRFVSVRPARRP
jgi:glutamate-1-semialdehyde 2,1-aminomutase